MTLQIGTQLAGHYQIVKSLSSGGFGETYIAEDSHRPGNPQCVLKHLKPVNNSPESLSTARRLFNSEAQVLEKLGEHPQIPRLFAYFEENEQFYLVQEFIAGHPLSAELPLGERWSETQVQAMLEDVLGILEFVHTQGVIHRDIKPDNIMRRGADNKLVLIDFGAIKEVGNQGIPQTVQGGSTVAIGTPGYMPTEQGRGKPRPSSDLYALGMIAIQALTGMLPNQLREDYETGEISWEDQAEVSPALAAVLTQMIRYHFKDRYQSAREVLTALQSPGSGGMYQPTEVAKPAYQPTEVANSQASQPRDVPPTQRATPPASPSLPSEPSLPASQSRETKDKNKTPILIGAMILGLLGFAGIFIQIRAENARREPELTNTSQIQAENDQREQELTNTTAPLEEFVDVYYYNINAGDYEESWNMMSYQLKNNSQSHPDGYASYLDWWTKVDYVDIHGTKIINKTSTTAQIQTDLQYTLNSGRIVNQTLIFSLVADRSSQNWSLNKTQRVEN